MGKLRFTDKDKWKDDWFYELSPYGKLVFLYLQDNVDTAGFMKVSHKRIKDAIGFSKEDSVLAMSEIEEKVLWSNRDDKVFLINFIRHQKNLPLNINNNAHKGIISEIRDSYVEFFDNIDHFENMECLVDGKPINLIKVLSLNNVDFKNFMSGKFRG